jgi:acetate kinase
VRAWRRQIDEPMIEHEAARKILVVNSGSSSLKYSVLDPESLATVAHGVVERIGAPGTRLVQRGPHGEVARELSRGDYPEAFAAMLRALSAPDTGVLHDASAIAMVGHRVVHGGERFAEAVVIDDAVLHAIDELAPLAPLHNPVNAAGIREARRVFPAVPHVAVFDTAFHHALPPHAYLYGLPYSYYEQKGIRRYGFHGMSHSYVSLAAAQHLGCECREIAIVSCHLGNGASLCAIDRGRSVDTSMGFTPGEGLIMGTRCGDLDAGALLHLQRVDGLSDAQAEELLNERSGLLGLSGISSDMREIEQAAGTGNRRALLALQAFSYRVRKYIGAYVAALGGLDVLIFTGGIGQGSASVRSLATQGLGCMGIDLDARRNLEARGFDQICPISTDDSPVKILIVPTDEEQMIARETVRAVDRRDA